MKKKHIHDDFSIDCPACTEWIRRPLPRMRVLPEPMSPADKEKAKLMEKIIDYEFATIKRSKVLKTPFGILIWSPK